MKAVVKKILRKAGWELRRTSANSRSTMAEGLDWLRRNNFDVKTVLDVGASNGCWSKECMRFFPKSKFVLFEPQPVHNEALKLFSKSYKQAVIIKKAVGPSDGYTFFDSSDPFGGSILKSNESDCSIEVEMTTIDSAVSLHQIECPFLLKLDTHGYEKGILSGAAKTIEKTKILIIEAYNYRITEEAFLFWELCAFLSDKGFRPIDLVDVLHRQYDNSLWQMDLFFIRSDWEGFKYTSYK